MLDPAAIENVRRIAKQMNDEAERKRKRRDLEQGIAYFLLSLVGGPLYVFALFAYMGMTGHG